MKNIINNNNNNNNNNTKEGFIPIINSIYRPYARATSTFFNNKINSISVYSNNFFKKNKLM